MNILKFFTKKRNIKTVSIKNLETVSAQEVYDFIANHLLKQGRKSLSQNGSCRYRHGSLSCAAGILLTDDIYDEKKFEGFPWCALVSMKVVPQKHEGLIFDLQSVHDNTITHEWPIHLTNVAIEHNLKPFNQWKK